MLKNRKNKIHYFYTIFKRDRLDRLSHLICRLFIAKGFFCDKLNAINYLVNIKIIKED
jgi:hypothetical protein